MLIFPAIHGVIDRRILVNYRVQPEILSGLLPDPFEPKMVDGYGIAGVCLIRLRELRPRWLGLQLGFTSENAAHRIAVHWQDGTIEKQGVYIPRRDTSSRLTTFLGGRAFPGVHHHASYQISEEDNEFHFEMMSDDGATNILLDGRLASQLPEASVFPSLDIASCFFEEGSLGYSARSDPGRFDGLELRTQHWEVQPLAVERVFSSYFDDRAFFPDGAAVFDHALLMRGIEHEWHSRQPLYADA